MQSDFAVPGLQLGIFFAHQCLHLFQGVHCLMLGLVEVFPPGNALEQLPTWDLNYHEIAVDLLLSKDSPKRESFIDVISCIFQTDVVKPVEEDCVASLYLGS